MLAAVGHTMEVDRSPQHPMKEKHTTGPWDTQCQMKRRWRWWSFCTASPSTAREDARKMVTTALSAENTVSTKQFVDSPLQSDLGKKQKVEDLSGVNCVQEVSRAQKRRQRGTRGDKTCCLWKTVCPKARRVRTAEDQSERRENEG